MQLRSAFEGRGGFASRVSLSAFAFPGFVCRGLSDAGFQNAHLCVGREPPEERWEQGDGQEVLYASVYSHCHTQRR